MYLQDAKYLTSKEKNDIIRFDEYTNEPYIICVKEKCIYCMNEEYRCYFFKECEETI